MRAINKIFFIVAVMVIQAACDGGGGPGRDTTPPAITLTGANPQIIEVGEAYTELGATATDNRDGDLTSSIVINASAVDSSVPGTYEVTYNVRDAAGNAAATVTRTVIYEDSMPPVITLQGDDPQVIILGNPYVELGATATDNVDGDLTNDIVIDTSSVNLGAVGDYEVTYDVSDAAGNAAVTVTRTVRVDPPTPGQAQVTVEGEIKQLIFSWDEVPYTDFYRLLENADGHSGFTQVGDDIPSGTSVATRDIAVHLFNWVDAQYRVEACNVTGCTASDVVTATDVMLDTIGYFKASNTDAKDEFGQAVAISADGKTLAVGSRYEASAANGIDGDEANNLAERAGAVYVFRNGSSGWEQVAYVKASNTEAYEGFGSDVALSGSGNTLVVGAQWEDSGATGINGDQSDNTADSAGAVYVFVYDGGTWVQQAYVKASNTDPFDNFGAAVDISVDGTVMAVGAPMDREIDFGMGAVYLFEMEGDLWVEKQIIDPPVATGEWFGQVIALSGNGERLAVLKPELRDENFPVGGVYIYRRSGDQWALETLLESSNIEPGDRFGCGMAINADGTVIAAGAPNESSGASGINGDQDDNSVAGAGAAYLFRHNGDAWIQVAYIKASNPGVMDLFGWTVALDSSGTRLVVGAGSEDSGSVGVSEGSVDNDVIGSGAAYLFAIDAFGAGQLSFIKASNTGAGDSFPKDIALSGDGSVLAIGTEREDSAAAGINGDQSDNSAVSSGAVYVY
jgi:hypothetical protein